MIKNRKTFFFLLFFLNSCAGSSIPSMVGNAFFSEKGFYKSIDDGLIYTKIKANDDKGSDSQYSKAYLRHLFMVNEILGKQIATIHNLTFYNNLLRIARNKIMIGEFSTWKRKVVKKLNTRI